MALSRRQIVRTIREYEEAAELPRDSRLTYVARSGEVHLRAGDGRARAFEAHAEKCAERLRFCHDVDRALARRLDKHELVRICDTPQVLVDLGFEPGPMHYTQKHLRDAVKPKNDRVPGHHGLTVPQLKRLPELFERPAIIADNPSRDDAVIMVLNAVDGAGLPLITSVRPHEGEYDFSENLTNMVLTVFGKDRFSHYFESVLTPDRIAYVDKEASRELERLSGSRFPGDYFNLGPENIIRLPSCVINHRTATEQAGWVGQGVSRRVARGSDLEGRAPQKPRVPGKSPGRAAAGGGKSFRSDMERARSVAGAHPGPRPVPRQEQFKGKS